MGNATGHGRRAYILTILCLKNVYCHMIPQTSVRRESFSYRGDWHTLSVIMRGCFFSIREALACDVGSCDSDLEARKFIIVGLIC